MYAEAIWRNSCSRWWLALRCRNVFTGVEQRMNAWCYRVRLAGAGAYPGGGACADLPDYTLAVRSKVSRRMCVTRRRQSQNALTH